jgi:hypothetical protein
MAMGRGSGICVQRTGSSGLVCLGIFEWAPVSIMLDARGDKVFLDQNLEQYGQYSSLDIRGFASGSGTAGIAESDSLVGDH